MISDKTIERVREFVYEQAVQYSAPAAFHLDLSNEKGQALADLLKANKNIVLLGTMLMDCMLGKALIENRLKDHIEMSARKAEEILSTLKEIEKSEVENIIACIRQHHGVEKFYSLEAEICCNADCYRFASIKGVLGGMITGRKMEMTDLMSLYTKKADEKWHTLTIDICIKELEPQYKILKQMFEQYS